MSETGSPFGLGRVDEAAGGEGPRPRTALYRGLHRALAFRLGRSQQLQGNSVNPAHGKWPTIRRAWARVNDGNRQGDVLCEPFSNSVGDLGVSRGQASREPRELNEKDKKAKSDDRLYKPRRLDLVAERPSAQCPISSALLLPRQALVEPPRLAFDFHDPRFVTSRSAVAASSVSVPLPSPTF